jgi:hypothetical protein
MIKAVTIHFTKSPLSIRMISDTLAPFTLRIPISLILRSVMKAASPSNPRQEMRIAIPAKYLVSIPIRVSASYCF